MFQDIIFVLMMVIAVGAGVITVVHEYGGSRDKRAAKDVKASELKEEEK